jgi:hypothetical protein
MGLAQKRIMAEYQEKKYPEWKKKLDDAAGFDLPIEVKWETLSDDSRDNKDLYFECFDKVYFKPLIVTIKAICADDMGKTAFREHVKKIIIDGSDGHSYSKTTFDKGVLYIKHKPFTNVDEEKDRATGWQKMIEAKL